MRLEFNIPKLYANRFKFFVDNILNIRNHKFVTLPVHLFFFNWETMVHTIRDIQAHYITQTR